MTRIQWFVVIAIAALLIALCWVEVTRGNDPGCARTDRFADVTVSWDPAF